MVINNDFIRNVNKVSQRPTTGTSAGSRPAGTDFASILQNKTKEQKAVKFSKHAELRLKTRNINLSDVQREKLAGAIDRAAEKGVKDSLIVMKDLAMVVNVPNRTVITAVNSSELTENVFTNIDGAVFA